MKSDRLTILLSGMIAGDPNHGGAAWAVLQYLLGLRQLGHDVYLVEPVKRDGLHLQRSESAQYLEAVATRFGFQGKWALLAAGTHCTAGLPYSRLAALAQRTDLVINISGMLTDPQLLQPAAVRCYLDLDPAFVQMWHAVQGIDMRFDAHSHFATVGLNIGSVDCDVPTCGRRWITTLQPVVLSHWPAAGPDGPVTRPSFTTIASWRGYGSIEHQGRLYGQKAHSIRKLLDLPRKVAQGFVPALGIHPGETPDLQLLRQHDWSWIDPATCTATPDDYRRFISQSIGELGIAKSGYVESHCGWFSDRSACFLASGRPVIAQDTGFAGHLPVGRGLFCFKTSQEAAEAAKAIAADYRMHCRAARRIAVEHFNSDSVLHALLQKLGVA